MGEFASKATGGTALGLSIGALGVEALNGGIARLLGNVGGIADTDYQEYAGNFKDSHAALELSFGIGDTYAGSGVQWQLYGQWCDDGRVQCGGCIVDGRWRLHCFAACVSR